MSDALLAILAFLPICILIGAITYFVTLVFFKTVSRSIVSAEIITAFFKKILYKIKKL